MKHKAPQPDFKFADEPFALVSEQTLDADRLQREQAQREQDKKESESKQQEFETPKRRPHEARGSAASNACFGAY